MKTNRFAKLNTDSFFEMEQSFKWCSNRLYANEDLYRQWRCGLIDKQDEKVLYAAVSHAPIINGDHYMMAFYIFENDHDALAFFRGLYFSEWNDPNAARLVAKARAESIAAEKKRLRELALKLAENPNIDDPVKFAFQFDQRFNAEFTKLSEKRNTKNE